MQSDAPVTVLMATYNGAEFLDEQLRSISGQQGVGRIDLHISDDGSTDETLARLAEWATRWDRGTFEVVRGPGQGFAENFRSMAAAIPVPEGYVAFSDQDDIWHPDKLAAAIRQLGPMADRPGVYLSRTRLVDISGAHLGESPLFARPPMLWTMALRKAGGRAKSGDSHRWAPEISTSRVRER